MKPDAKKKILIVEDNIEELKALEDVLSVNFHVISASDLSQALSLMGQDLDLALSDVVLNANNPENRDGVFLLRAMKEKFPHIPVIMITPYGNGRLESEVRSLGAIACLPKPFNMDEVENLALKLLGLRPKPKLWEIGKRGFRNWLAPLSFFILMILLWAAMVELFDIPGYLIPAPYKVASQIRDTAWSLMKDTGITMLEAVLGFLLGSGFGFVIAIGFAHSKTMERSLYPYMIALKAIPLVAIAPLLVLWFGTGILGKVVMAALICFFPAIVNTAVGLKSIDREALDLMHSLSASKWQIFTKREFDISIR